MKLIVVVEDNYKLRAKIPRESYFLTAICQYLTKHTQKKKHFDYNIMEIVYCTDIP